MARQALFPETISDVLLQPDESGNIDKEEDEIDALLATLATWNSKNNEVNSDTSDDFKLSTSSASHDERLVSELQEWRRKHTDQLTFDQWSQEEKTAFDTWVKKFVVALAPETALTAVDLEETKKNLLEKPPQSKESANEFWSQLRDETAAEMFLQNLLESKDTRDHHPFWSLDYQTQIQRLVNLGTVREIANEYATETDRSKFLARYGGYLLEGIRFDHLIRDPNGPILGSDLGDLLQAKYEIKPSDRFILRKLEYTEDEASEEARRLFQAWNKLKAGRANYEEKQFQKGLLGLSYEVKQKPS
jgi:hypothetical protein